MTNETLSLDEIKKILRYDAQTGEFFWTDSAPYKVAGKKAVSCDPLGYKILRINGRNYKAHRVAWAITYGEFPKKHIDHINGVPSDNRICNLREVSHDVNMQNLRRARSDSSTGLLGVSKNGSGWRAEIRIKGKKKNLGTFQTPEIAYAAYVAAKRKYHEGCTI